MNASSVDVQPIEGYPVLKMTWQHKIKDEDVTLAFRKIVVALETSDQPIYVIVDLLDDPQFPLLATVHEGIVPYRHTKLKEWLVVGSSWMAQMIASTLAKITQNQKVRWFKTEADAMTYLQAILAT